MSTLAEKIRKSRESRVEADGFTFLIRRPTDVQMVEFSTTRKTEALLQHVVGWEDVKESDLYPGGEGHPAAFDVDACFEWLTDRADLMATVVTAILDAYQRHKQELETAEKN